MPEWMNDGDLEDPPCLADRHKMHCRFTRETPGQILQVMRLFEAARQSQDRGEVIDVT